MRTDPEKLIARAACDPKAFTDLYEIYSLRLLTYMRYRCDDVQTAEDLTARVFEKVLRNLPRFQAKDGNFEAWLFTIARNVVTDHYRAQRRRSWLPWEKMLNKPAGEQPVETQIETGQDHRAVVDAVRRLKARERDLLGMRFGAKFTNRQIAAQTGLSEQNVAVIIFRTLKKLRDELPGIDQTHNSEVDHE